MQLLKSSLFEDPNLKGYFRFLESNLTIDSSGNGNSLTNSGGEDVNGKFGNGIILQSGENIGKASNFGLNASTGPWSIGFWVKLASEISSGNQNFCVFNWDNGIYDLNQSIGYDYNSGSRRVRLARYNHGLEETHYAYKNINLSTLWHLILSTYDGTTMKLYVDDLAVSSTASPNNGGGTPSVVYTNSINLYGGAVNVRFDDFFVANRVITDTERLELYKSKSGIFLPFINN